MYTKNQSIRELVDKNRILIAAHRGTHCFMERI